MTDSTPEQKPAALIGRRLLSLFYDLWPVVAIWMLLSLLFNLGYLLAGHDEREYIAPFTPLAWLLWLSCWFAAGLYATISWHRGGQTLGMRPWRLRVTAADGGPAQTRALWLRYAVGGLSLMCAGLGFWWAWFDRDRLTWHDRASRTRVVRANKRSTAP